MDHVLFMLNKQETQFAKLQKEIQDIKKEALKRGIKL